MRLLALATALALAACGRPSAGTPGAPPVLGDLRVHLAGGSDGHGGGDGPVVVLLHGYGGSWANVAEIGAATRAPGGTRWVFPEAPLPHRGGRAWWMLDLPLLRRELERGARSLQQPPEGLVDARRRVARLLEDVERRMGAPPSRVVLGGFSQGAMLSCDVALRMDRPAAGLALFSGMLVAEDEVAPLLARRRGLPVLVSHGRDDDVLPFFLGEKLRESLSSGGLAVRWVPFSGGHDVSDVALERFGELLRDVFP